jgi:hypothetical protein
MVKSGKTTSRGYSDEQIEDLLELQRDMMCEKIEYLEDKIGHFPFFSLALAFILGFALGIALTPRSSK